MAREGSSFLSRRTPAGLLIESCVPDQKGLKDMLKRRQRVRLRWMRSPLCKLLDEYVKGFPASVEQLHITTPAPRYADSLKMVRGIHSTNRSRREKRRVLENGTRIAAKGEGRKKTVAIPTKRA